MCFSERESWITLVASWSGCAVLWASGDPAWRAVAVFFAVVGSMQLWEALLWRESRCTNTNVMLSRAGAITNHAEPLVYLAACMAYVRPVSPGLETLAIGTGVAYAVAFAALTMSFLARPKEAQCTLDGGNGLVWAWNEYGNATVPSYALFLTSLMLTTYAYLPPGMNALVGIPVLTSFWISYMIYKDTGMIGSMWCFYAAILPWLFVAVK